MRLKLTFVYLSCFLCLANFCTATTTVTGHIQTLGTGSVSTAAYVRFWLRGCSGNQPRVSGTAVIAPSAGGVFYFDFTASTGGLISGTLYSTRDSSGLLAGDIQCGVSNTGVWYGMQVFQNGKGGPEVPVHAISGAVLDVSTVLPLTTTPVATPPAGDSVYARIDTLNQPFVGDVQVPRIGVGRPPLYKMQVEAATAGDVIAKFKNTDPTGFGVKFVPGADANYGIAVENNAETANNFTVDGLGNVNSNGTINGSTGSFGTFSTTGAGFTQTFQTQTAPSNPPSGNMLWYGDSGTNKWACLNHDGSSCAPGGAAFSGISAGANSNAGTFSATGNSWDFTGTTIFKLRVGSGCTTTVVGDICYDNSAAKMWHIWQNGADNFLFTGSAAGSYTDQDCVKLTKTGSIINLADSGGACGGSGSASPIMFGCPAFTNTVTQFCGGGNIGTAEPVAQVPVPRSGTVSNLQCRVGGTGLSSAQTIAFTVRKGSASIGLITSADTTVTCTMNSTNLAGCNDGTHNFTVAAGDVLDIKTVPANSPSNVAFNCSVQLL